MYRGGKEHVGEEKRRPENCLLKTSFYILIMAAIELWLAVGLVKV